MYPGPKCPIAGCYSVSDDLFRTDLSGGCLVEDRKEANYQVRERFITSHNNVKICQNIL